MNRKASSTGKERTEQALEMRFNVHSDEETLTDKANIHKGSQIYIDDWSLTGRGFHVDFRDKEAVPLGQGEQFHYPRLRD